MGRQAPVGSRRARGARRLRPPARRRGLHRAQARVGTEVSRPRRHADAADAAGPEGLLRLHGIQRALVRQRPRGAVLDAGRQAIQLAGPTACDRRTHERLGPSELSAQRSRFQSEIRQRRPRGDRPQRAAPAGAPPAAAVPAARRLRPLHVLHGLPAAGPLHDPGPARDGGDPARGLRRHEHRLHRAGVRVGPGSPALRGPRRPESSRAAGRPGADRGPARARDPLLGRRLRRRAARQLWGRDRRPAGRRVRRGVPGGVQGGPAGDRRGRRPAPARGAQRRGRHRPLPVRPRRRGGRRASVAALPRG